MTEKNKTRNKQRLKPDIVLYDYWKDNEKFSDLINALFFNAEQIIKPDDLINADSDNSTIVLNKHSVKTLKSDRDLLKIVKFCEKLGVRFALFGAENQTDIHYAMPVRVMQYDTNTYYNQYQQLKKHYEETKELKEEEFLSGIKKDDRLYPVITIVLYYGEKPWDGPKALKEMLDIPNQLQKFVNDYKMNLVEARDNKLIFHNTDNKDLFNLLQLLYNDTISKKERQKQAIEYNNEHNVSTTVAIAIASAAKSKISLDKIAQGDGDMCSVFEEIAQENKLLGIEQGIKVFIESFQEIDVPQEVTFKKLIDKFNLKKEDAQQYMQKWWK